MLLHHGEVHRVACRHLLISQDNLLRTFCNYPVHRQHFIHHPEQSVKSRLDGVPAVDGNVTVQNLLKHLRIGDQSLAVRDHSFQQSLSVRLVHVRRADKIHWDIGIDENHE